jgi:hypothetical protein
MVRHNSMRIRRMFNKAVPDDGALGMGEVGGGGGIGEVAPPERKAPPPPREKSGGGSGGGGGGGASSNSWQARRKQSFAAVFGQGSGYDPGSIEGHLHTAAKESNRDVADVIRNVTISKPYEVEHKLRVKFDEENIRFSGLPEDWVKEAHRQFGIPLQSCPRVDAPGYADRIPLVLVKLKQRFIELDGFRTEGIFRLAPDGGDCADVKSSLNAGQALVSLQTTKDPHVVANLIKQFFRELKPKILCSLKKEQVIELAAGQDDFKEAGAAVMGLPEPQRSTFLWLLDLLADVAAEAQVNKMNWGNLASTLGGGCGVGLTPVAGQLYCRPTCTTPGRTCRRWRNSC